VVCVVVVVVVVVKVDRRPVGSGAAIDTSFLDDGSPTMMEKGMDPASVFEMCDDDDDNGIHDVKEAGAGGGATAAAEAIHGAGAVAGAAPMHSGSESVASLRHRRRGKSTERPEPKTKRESWIDPPEEKESTALTQAEMESCMQTYAVRRTALRGLTPLSNPPQRSNPPLCPPPLRGLTLLPSEV